MRSAPELTLRALLAHEEFHTGRLFCGLHVIAGASPCELSAKCAHHAIVCLHHFTLVSSDVGQGRSLQVHKRQDARWLDSIFGFHFVPGFAQSRCDPITLAVPGFCYSTLSAQRGEM